MKLSILLIDKKGVLPMMNTEIIKVAIGLLSEYIPTNWDVFQDKKGTTHFWYEVPLRSNMDNLFVKVIGGKAIVANFYGKEIVAPTRELQTIIAELEKVSKLKGEGALRRFAEICTEFGRAGFVGAEEYLNEECVVATLLWEELLREGYSWQTLYQLKKDAFAIGEDSVICPSSYVETELESAIWRAAGWAA
jgi:hypothetical protein